MNDAVVVLGATGTLGREITPQLLAAGHRVVAVARNVERLRSLADTVNGGGGSRLTVIPRSVANEFDASLLVRALREQGERVTTVVAALRGTLQGGRLLDRSASDLLRALDQEVVTNFVAAKHLLPLVAESGPNGFYLLLGGPMASCAWSGYGHVSVSGAALQMLTQVLREEAKDLPVTVQQLQIGTPVRSAANADCACPDWIGAADVARRVVELVARRDRHVPIVQLGSYQRPAADPLRARAPRTRTAP